MSTTKERVTKYLHDMMSNAQNPGNDSNKLLRIILPEEP
jgi:hypothetical protein